MTDIVLHDVDQVLVDRIKRVADARGWTVPRTLLHLLEQGLHVYEGDGRVRFDNSENDVLEAALAALEGIPDDAGFATDRAADARLPAHRAPGPCAITPAGRSGAATPFRPDRFRRARAARARR